RAQGRSSARRGQDEKHGLISFIRYVIRVNRHVESLNGLPIAESQRACRRSIILSTSSAAIDGRVVNGNNLGTAVGAKDRDGDIGVVFVDRIGRSGKNKLAGRKIIIHDRQGGGGQSE